MGDIQKTGVSFKIPEFFNNTDPLPSYSITFHANFRVGRTVSNGAVPARGFLTGMAQAVRALDCPWSDMTRLVLEVAPCR